MAVYTQHPVAAPPTPPAREATSHLLVRAFSVLSLFGVFAHTAVYNLLGVVGASTMLAVLTLAALAIWVPRIARARPAPLRWRRLPWVALGYVALALVSVLWSRWPGATLLTWSLLAAVTVFALFLATLLTWHEIVRALSSTLKLVLIASLLIEVWVALVLRHPLLPNFTEVPPGKIDPHLYWVRGNLLHGGQIQGVVGNAHTLGMLCLFALIVFGVLFASHARRRGALLVWAALALLLMVRAASATVFLAAVAALVVVAAVLVVRAVPDPDRRRRVYGAAAVVLVALAAAAIALRPVLFGLLGKSSDLTGRVQIWQDVWARAITRPVFGNGFSSPWVPWDPGFDGWILNHGLTVFHAHEMWLDVFLQLGAVGVALMAAAWLAALWRAWFFAVDRPRWDLEAHRPYSPLSVLPVLLIVVLLLEGLAESAPIMLWGWLTLVLLSFKMKSVPLVGVGIGERTPMITHGPRARRVP